MGVCGGQWLRLWAQTDLGGSRHVLTPWEWDAGDNSRRALGMFSRPGSGMQVITPGVAGPRDVPIGGAGAGPRGSPAAGRPVR